MPWRSTVPIQRTHASRKEGRLAHGTRKTGQSLLLCPGSWPHPETPSRYARSPVAYLPKCGRSNHRVTIEGLDQAPGPGLVYRITSANVFSRQRALTRVACKSRGPNLLFIVAKRWVVPGDDHEIVSQVFEDVYGKTPGVGVVCRLSRRQMLQLETCEFLTELFRNGGEVQERRQRAYPRVRTSRSAPPKAGRR